MTSFYEELRKTASISDEQENAQSRKNVDKWIFRLLLFLIGFMPLIVLANVEEVVSPLIANVDLLSSGAKGELFTHYKALLLAAITCIAGSMLVIKVLFMGGTIRRTFLNYVLGVVVVAIIVSTVMSPNISIALNGQYNRSDGAISWLCYMALLFITMNIEYPKNMIRYVMYTLTPFILINLFITTMNFFGKDILQSEFMQKSITLFLPEGASLGQGSVLLGTLNHGNYMSGMFVIMTVMYLVWALVEKKVALQVVAIVVAIAAVLVVLMSLSTSGFLTFICIAPFIIWVAFKSEKKAVSFGIIVVFLAVSGLSLHMLAKENAKVWDETFGFFLSTNPYVEEIQQPVVSVTQELNSANPLFGTKAYASEQAVELPSIPGTGIGAGSGRIYIWTYMLNLIKERPLTGYGMDTLMYNFQHYNVDARANLETETVIVDKPHNMYMGVLYGTGAVGFIAFMVLVLTIIWSAFKQIFKQQINGELLTVFAVGALAFLFQAIFNDSLAGISGPIFVIIGLLLKLLLDMYGNIDFLNRKGGSNGEI